MQIAKMKRYVMTMMYTLMIYEYDDDDVLRYMYLTYNYLCTCSAATTTVHVVFNIHAA